MYNNFLSKKSKKAISALLASALVITAAPISAEAATTKILGVGKSTAVSVSAKAKVTGLSKTEKKVVKITKKGKKFTIKGLKAGKVNFKIGKKAFTVKVGATSIKKKTFATSLTVGTNKNVSVTAANGKADTLTWKSSNTKVVKVSKASSKASSKKVASNTLKPVKAGKANITITSKNTGKKLTVKVTVKAKVTPTKVPAATTEAPVATTQAPDTTTGPATTTQAPDTTTGPVATTEAPATTSGPAATTEAPDVTTGPATTETPAPGVTTAAAVSASAINTKTLAVKFNRDLTADEQADVLKVGNVAVVNNGVTQNTKAAFENASTLYITTSTSTKFAKGTYTITLKGDIQFTKEVVVDDADVQSIAIKSTTVEAVTNGAIKIDLLDQYGDNVEFVKSDFTVTAINKTASDRTIGWDVVDKTLVLNTTKANVNDEIILTVVYNKKGLADSKTITVVAQDYVNALTLGTPFSAASSRITTATTDTKIEYTATKFYGDETTIALGADKDYNVISSNEAVVLASKVGVTTDSVSKKNFITISGFEGAGTATLVFVNNKTGATVNVVITVLTAAGVPTTATIEKNEVTVAAGSTAYVGLTVKDNYDEVIGGDKFQITATSTNNEVGVSLVSDKNDANFGKVKVDASRLTVGNQTVVATISINGSTVAPMVLTIKVADAAKPQSISAKADADKLMVGGTTTIKVTAMDQYAGQFALAGSDRYTLSASVNGTDGVVTATKKTNDEITVTANKAGTAVVAVRVAGGDVNLATEVTINVEANDATNFTYAVGDVAVLNPTGAAVKEKYAQKVTVKATKKTDANVSLDVPSDKIISVASDNNIVKAEKLGNDWVVYGNSDKALTADTTANLTVTILTDNGYETVQKTVTVSKDTPKVKAVAFYATNELKTTQSNLTVASSAALTIVSGTGVAINLATEDQYGVKTPIENVTASAVNVTNKDGVELTVAGIKDGKLIVEDLKATKANASFKVNVLVDGVYTALTVTITDKDA